MRFLRQFSDAKAGMLRAWVPRWSALAPMRALENANVSPRDEAGLRRAYRASGLDQCPDSFVLHRIIGNDLEPRHCKGQSRDNLRFILENEPPLESCERRWVVNRIVDADEERAILALLEAHGQDCIHIRFDPAEYRRVGWDTGCFPHPGFLQSRAFRRLDAEARQRFRLATYRLKNNYVMHNNAARNAALREGRGLAKWVLPWDGNCFVTTAAWEAIRTAVTDRPHLRYFVVPMARVADNAALLRGDFVPNAVEEPQVLFRSDAAEEFNPAFCYGRRPKVELFWRLGIPGKWDRWTDDPWDQPRRARAREARQFGTAGWVARLSSGRRHLEQEDTASFKNRGLARQDAIAATLDALDDGLENPDAVQGGLLHYSPEALLELRGRPTDGLAGGLAAAVVADAEAALTRGPFSVVDKTTLPPSGDRHDYWHAAPYWWPNPYIPGGLPYIQRDGRRVPGTEMYAPESERYDRTRLQRLFDDTTSLALAWRLTGRVDFAAHAARNIAVWFVAPATRMAPHLRYAQVRMGWNRGQGTGAGIIEFKDLHYFLDAARILERDGALDAAVGAGLSAWLADYLDWLSTSRQGLRERASRNNHGTYYDLQVAAVAAHVGARDTLRETLVRAQSRLVQQFAPSGEQPEELRRATTAHYCFFNLQGWMSLIRIGRRTGLLRPDYAAEPWTRMQKAVTWVLDRDLAAWPHRQITPFDPGRAVPLAIHAMENGLAVGGAADAAAAPPVFDPHDGIAPYWALTGIGQGRQLTSRPPGGELSGTAVEAP